MVIFVVAQSGTLREVMAAAPDLDLQMMQYPVVFSATTLPRATYVFTDFDRLSPRDLRSATHVHASLRKAGCRVLNDPVRARSRLGLLRGLYNAGINRFNAYRVEEDVKPERWPVFLRHEGSHDSPFPELYYDWDALRRGIDDALERGAPLPALLITEYAAEPVRPGLFRKLGCFELGAARFAHTCVHDDHWIAKHGKKGIAGEEMYLDELRIARDNPFGEKLHAAFRIAGLDYGRADFGLVAGEVQVYEINSNPEIKFGPKDHPSPHRLAAIQSFRDNLLAALRAVDMPNDGSRIANDAPILARHRKPPGTEQRARPRG